MKTKSKISGYIIRSAAWALFLSVAFIAASSAFNSPNRWQSPAGTTGGYDVTGKTSSQPRAVSFAERVAYQRAIEDVYWRHRIWPKENPNPKPSLDAVMSQAQLENKVAGYLHDSLAVENYGRPITAERLQAEIERMARNTKQPEVLQELFKALGNDPTVIAECLARPILAARLIANFSSQGQTRHVESPQSDELHAMSVATALGQVVYTLPEIAETCADDTWTATTTANAPLGRRFYTAVWTGNEMIVWGGEDNDNLFNTGGRYNPSTDSWTATNTNNAPEARYFHTAVWTGSEMIVWGGEDNDNLFNTGGRYNPSTNTWTVTSTTYAPTARTGQTAIWTGSEMIVWGGYDGHVSNTGGKYNPGTNTWTATSTINAPTDQGGPTAIWTGSEMIVWGGRNDNNISLNTGGRYNPSTNSWRATSLTNAPTARFAHTAVWTGSEMIIWGGFVLERGVYLRTRTGGKYNPATDSWVPTSRLHAPAPRGEHTVVWTGSEMIVWGGNPAGPPPFSTGGRYEPITDSWRATTLTNAPTGSDEISAVWTGSEMIIWGGLEIGGNLNSGGRYCVQPPQPPITVIQPNGGEVWPAGSVQQIKWDQNLKHTDHLIIQYSRDGGASWFRIAQDIPAFTVAYWWQVDNFPTTQGRMRILLQENVSVADQSDANFTVQAP
jgi:N-acetylneuraminic acid mutarotase